MTTEPDSSVFTDEYFASIISRSEKEHRPKEGELTPPTILLIEDLEEAKKTGKYDRKKIETMIEKAKREYYHDVLSDVAFPIIQLVSDANDAKLTDISKEAQDGKYDA